MSRMMGNDVLVWVRPGHNVSLISAIRFHLRPRSWLLVMTILSSKHFPSPPSTPSTRCVHADTCVTVVDSSMFFKHLHSAKRLRDSELGDGVETDETEELTSQLLVNQVEFADVILLNKTDLLEQVDMLSVKDTLEMLNPSARVIPCSFSQVRCRLAAFVSNLPIILCILVEASHSREWKGVTIHLFTCCLPLETAMSMRSVILADPSILHRGVPRRLCITMCL